MSESITNATGTIVTAYVEDTVFYILRGVGRLFYIVSPASTRFDHYTDVPDYIAESIPFFVLTITLEFLTLLFKEHGKGLTKQNLWDTNRYSVNDIVGSIGVRPYFI